MYIHQLPIDEAECFKFLFPLEVLREEGMRQR